jgi:ABC-type antimicrobial peptide transport system permease subunit
MLVAAVGLYGLIAYLVTQRTREIAIRMALGASPSHIRTEIVGGGVRLLAPGLVIGVVGTAGVGRLAAAFLYGVGVVDWVSLAGAVVLLGAVVVTASYLPARRAMRIDPAVALRR